MNITFMGGGNMATAIIGGLVSGGADAREFRVVESLRSQQDKLVGQFPGIGIFGEASAGAIDGADILVLAVKPQQMREAVAPLAATVWFATSEIVGAVFAGGTRAVRPSIWRVARPPVASQKL